VLLTKLSNNDFEDVFLQKVIALKMDFDLLSISFNIDWSILIESGGINNM